MKMELKIEDRWIVSVTVAEVLETSAKMTHRMSSQNHRWSLIRLLIQVRYVDGEIVREGVVGDQGAGKYSSG